MSARQKIMCVVLWTFFSATFWVNAWPQLVPGFLAPSPSEESYKTPPSAPKISVSPTSINFGTLNPGSTAQSTVTVSNTGTANLLINSITLSGTNAPEFSEADDCGTVKSGGSCTATVTFAPVTTGKKSATLSIASSSPQKPTVNVRLAGNAKGSANQPNLVPYQPQGWSDKIVVTNNPGCTYNNTNNTFTGCTDSSPLLSTDTLYVDWAVINNGSGATTVTFYTDLIVDGTDVNRWHTDPPLNPNYMAYITDFSIGSLSAGTHTVQIRADSTNTIGPSQQYTKTITVGSSSSTCPTPGTPSNPSPSSGATGVSTSPTLSWSATSNTNSYSVYFGISSNPPLVGNTNSSNDAESGLSSSTLYYWQVVAKNSCGNSTPGPVWSFTTGGGGGGGGGSVTYIPGTSCPTTSTLECGQWSPSSNDPSCTYQSCYCTFTAPGVGDTDSGYWETMNASGNIAIWDCEINGGLTALQISQGACSIQSDPAVQAFINQSCPPPGSGPCGSCVDDPCVNSVDAGYPACPNCSIDLCVNEVNVPYFETSDGDYFCCDPNQGPGACDAAASNALAHCGCQQATDMQRHK